MSPSRILVGLLLAGVLAAPLSAQRKRLTLEQTVLGRGEFVHFFAGFPDLEWTTDGKQLQQAGNDERAVARRAELAAALRALPETAAAAAALAEKAEPAAGDAVWVAYQNDLYYHRRGGPARRLTRDGAEKLEAELSPDGAWIAFVSGHDLYAVDTGSGERVRLTEDGGPELLNGRLDWVYQEEVYERGNFKGYWWSPTGEALAFYRLDESQVRDFTVVDHVPDPGLEQNRAVVAEVTKYPKAGDPNPGLKLGIARPRGGGTTWIDLGGYDPDVLVVRVGWTPGGERVVLEVQDRIQTWLDLCAADPETGAVTRLLREESDSWVNILGLPRWLADGSFLWLSERTGYKHVYHHEADGRLRRAVTSGEWAVDEILAVDEERGHVWFTGARDGAINAHAYRVELDGSDLVRLTRDDGTHEIVLSPDRTMFIDTFSSLATPPELRMCKGDGTVLQVLQKAPVPALESHLFAVRELHEVKARDGFAMDVSLLKPPDFDPEASYPVFLDVYAGPDTPSVVNAWNAGADPFHQFLAQQGVLVLQVNNRTASGKGQVFTAACYKDFGASELRDLEDALDWLCAHPWADGERVAISGWSYGGTMAAYALTHSKRFVLGIAGAGVYDWRLYDTIYTERYMDTPQANPDGYRRSSSIAAAADLSGHLVILHGTMDDNVHLQNALHLAWALQRAGKDFEIMLYPKSRHGVRDDEQRYHMRRLVWRAVRTHLRLP